MIASSAWGQLPDHWALLLLDNSYRTIKILTAFFSAIHAIWSLSSCIYHEFKEILRKISLSEYFKAISLYFCVCSLSGLTAARYIYTSSSSSLLALGNRSPVLAEVEFRWQIFNSEDFQPLVEWNVVLCLPFSFSCLRNWPRFTDSKHCLTDDESRHQPFMNKTW